ncbi:MAG: universal stress protein [Gemmatimonadaceae bacterium]
MSISASDLNLSPVVLATRGRKTSDGAVRVASQLVSALDADVSVLSVFDEEFPKLIDFTAGLPAPPGFAEAQQQELETAVEDQRIRTVTAGSAWPTTIAGGNFDDLVKTFADQRQAQLVIIGRGCRPSAKCWTSNERTLKLARTLDRPVLAVVEDAPARFKRVVIAMDYSPYSIQAARVAAAIADPAAHLFLVHVRPVEGLLPSAAAAWMQSLESAMPGMNEEVIAQMHVGEHQVVETISLVGDTADKLLEFAESLQADLIATSTHGYGLVNRFLLGSVASSLSRRLNGSYLCVPATFIRHRVSDDDDADDLQRRSMPREQLSAHLAQFSVRNSGRIMSLASENMNGAQQSLCSRVVFSGLDYDPTDESVQIMAMADSTDHGRHITHNVPRVVSAELLTDRLGTDCGFVVANKSGKTELRFEP